MLSVRLERSWIRPSVWAASALLEPGSRSPLYGWTKRQAASNIRPDAFGPIWTIPLALCGPVRHAALAGTRPGSTLLAGRRPELPAVGLR
jgi:hypothetical protein